MKVCIKCQKEKAFSEFPKNYACKNKFNKIGIGLRTTCKKCYSTYQSDKKREYKFGVSLDTYNKMVDNQSGVCSICKNPPTSNRRLCVDHCHDTEKNEDTIKVRGLLCSACNLGLGNFRDNVDSLQEAIKYLKESINV